MGLGGALLALLYTLLREGELRAAVELTELLIRQQDARATLSACAQDAATKNNVLALLQKVCNVSLGVDVLPIAVQCWASICLNFPPSPSLDDVFMSHEKQKTFLGTLDDLHTTSSDQAIFPFWRYQTASSFSLGQAALATKVTMVLFC